MTDAEIVRQEQLRAIQEAGGELFRKTPKGTSWRIRGTDVKVWLRGREEAAVRWSDHQGKMDWAQIRAALARANAATVPVPVPENPVPVETVEEVKESKMGVMTEKTMKAAQAALRRKRRARCGRCGELTTTWLPGHLAHVRGCNSGKNGTPAPAPRGMQDVSRGKRKTIKAEQWLPPLYVVVGLRLFRRENMGGKSDLSRTIYIKAEGAERFQEVVEVIKGAFQDDVLLKPTHQTTARRALMTLRRLDRDLLRELLREEGR